MPPPSQYLTVREVDGVAVVTFLDATAAALKKF